MTLFMYISKQLSPNCFTVSFFVDFVCLCLLVFVSLHKVCKMCKLSLFKIQLYLNLVTVDRIKHENQNNKIYKKKCIKVNDCNTVVF